MQLPRWHSISSHIALVNVVDNITGTDSLCRCHNVINFMDGINGITAGYSLAVLIPLALVNTNGIFVEQSLIISTVLASLVFCIFNFRPKGNAKCFAGDVGSIGIAFIILFLLGNVMIKTTDITWLIFL